LSVANIEELMTTDHFQYVIIQALDCYFSYDLLDEIECACIFALIQTKATDAINGWMVSKILPQWAGGYSDWLLYEKQFANVSSSDNNECGQIPDSIIYSGGFDSDEVKGSSKADSSDSDEVKGSSKVDSSDSDSKECFTYNYHSKIEEKKLFGLRPGKQKKSIFPVLMVMNV
jgi:hypothetical protein